MTAQTQRWMQRELQQLLAQRARYVQAESASTDVRQKVSHTTQRLRLDDEIQGRREAIAALEDQGGSRRRDYDRGLSRLRPAAGPAPARSHGSIVPLTLGVCVATFALGFIAMGQWVSTSAPTPPAPIVKRYKSLNPPPPVRIQKRTDDRVMAAMSESRRPRR